MGMPIPSKFKVDDNGVVTMTEVQWKWLLKHSGSKAQTHFGQKKAIEKFLVKILDFALKHYETNSNR